MQDYVQNVLKISTKKSRTGVRAVIIFKDLRTGRMLELPPSVFRQKIKPTYDQINDFLKIEPEHLGTTHSDLMKSSYEAMKNKLIQK